MTPNHIDDEQVPQPVMSWSSILGAFAPWEDISSFGLTHIPIWTITPDNHLLLAKILQAGYFLYLLILYKLHPSEGNKCFPL